MCLYLLFTCRISKRVTLSSQINNNKPREANVFSLLISYRELNFEVIKKLIIPDMQMVMIYG